MPDINKAGVALGRRVAEAYAANPQVRAVMLSGSFGLGAADEYSDLDIGVFWSASPSDEDRKAAVERLGGDLWSFDPRPPEGGGSAKNTWVFTLRPSARSDTRGLPSSISPI